jgi:DNA-3-methyladenine glycosylase
VEGASGVPVTLPRAFYERPAPVVARALLGCVLVTRRGRVVTAGRIVETEAYLGPEDGASHAAFRPSSRPLFYGPGGRAYVYRAYGVHLCLNAIAGPPGTPGCVLIRALEPAAGAVLMRRGRGATRRDGPGVASGPGRLTRALGIRLADSGTDLTGRAGGRLAIRARGPGPPPPIATGPRVGIRRATGRRLRFWIRDHPDVSPPRGRRPS